MLTSACRLWNLRAYKALAKLQLPLPPLKPFAVPVDSCLHYALVQTLYINVTRCFRSHVANL